MEEAQVEVAPGPESPSAPGQAEAAMAFGVHVSVPSRPPAAHGMASEQRVRVAPMQAPVPEQPARAPGQGRQGTPKAALPLACAGDREEGSAGGDC